MNNLANIKRTMTSREIAEYTGKRHSDVMEAIRTMELGLFEVKKTSISKPDGTVLVTTTPKVTGKGQVYFVNKLLKGQEA